MNSFLKKQKKRVNIEFNYERVYSIDPSLYDNELSLDEEEYDNEETEDNNTSNNNKPSNNDNNKNDSISIDYIICKFSWI